MVDTTARPPVDQSKLARGVQMGGPPPLVDLGFGNPCGSMYTTANDMAKFMSFMLRDGAARDDNKAQPLDSATTRRWLTDRVLVNPTNLACSNCIEFTEWGAPWHTMRANMANMGNFSRFHLMIKDGGITGYDAYLAFQPDFKLGMFAAMSTSGGGYAPFFDDVPHILAFDIIPPLNAYMAQHQPSRLPPTVSDFVGNYTLVTHWGKFQRTNWFSVRHLATGPSGSGVLYGLGHPPIAPPMCTSHPGCPLGWERGDDLIMLPEPKQSCTLTEEGDQYTLHFTRKRGSVVSMKVEGNGPAGNGELQRHPATH